MTARRKRSWATLCRDLKKVQAAFRAFEKKYKGDAMLWVYREDGGPIVHAVADKSKFRDAPR